MKQIPKLQKERASAMRNAPTEAEARLWGYLRYRQIEGRKFSRQIAIGVFTADFVCRELMLAVEVDGGQHGDAGDQARQLYIEARGYHVLRFWNHEVLGNTEGVLAVIAAALAENPPPAPPVKAGGEQEVSKGAPAFCSPPAFTGGAGGGPIHRQPLAP